MTWTLRKKIFWYYGRIALGLAVLGVTAYFFQKLVEAVGKAVTVGDLAGIGRLLLIALIAVPLLILLLYLVDRWYGNILSRMSGQKGLPLHSFSTTILGHSLHMKHRPPQRQMIS